MKKFPWKTYAAWVLLTEAVGGLFAFLELSSALTALLCGGDPFTPVTGPAVPAALNRLRDGEM